MSNTLKLSGAISIGKLAADPANPEKGLLYYNTTSDELRHYNGTEFKQVTSQEELDAILGTLDASPTNYTPTEATHAGHLAGIDSALASAGADEFGDDVFRINDNIDSSKKIAFEASAISAATTRTVSMPDSDVNLSDIATNNAKVSADGSVTSHSDVSDAGSGAIITVAERSKLSGIESGATADQTGAEIKAAYEAEANTNAFTDAEQSKLAGIESGATADQTGAEIKAAYEAEANTNAFTDAEQSKLAGIEALADVTDATNVDAAGATMNTDTSLVGNSYFLDEDDMSSDDATKVPSQQSVKAYVDAEVANAVAGGAAFQGDYDAATDSPSLDDGSPIAGISQGDMYVVNVAGTFFTIDVEIGDMLIAKQASPTLESHWSVVQANLTPSSIKTQYESNSDTNAFTDAEQSKLAGIESGATADQTGAEIKSAYEAEADTNAFTDAEKSKLAGIQSGAEVNRTLDAVPTDGNTANSVSSDGVFDALALKADASALAAKLENVVEDTTPQLGGDLDANGNAIEDASNELLLAGNNSVRRAKQASKTDFIEEEYIHGIALSGSQTNAVMSDLTFAHASVEGCEISYKVKEATSNDIRIGTMRVVTNGSNVVLNDMATETADTGISFSAAINGANVEIRYSSGTNGATLRCDVKRFKA